MIDLLNILFFFVVIALVDLGTTKSLRLVGYDYDAYTYCSKIIFIGWYATVIFFFAFTSQSFLDGLIKFAFYPFLHYAGFEDLLFYLLEPLIKQPNREQHYPTKILCFRFPVDMHYLGEGVEGHPGLHDRLLELFGGKNVSLRGFLICNIICCGIVIGIKILI